MEIFSLSFTLTILIASISFGQSQKGWKKCTSLDKRFKCSEDKFILLSNSSDMPIFVQHSPFSMQLSVSDTRTMTFGNVSSLWRELVELNITELAIYYFCDVDRAKTSWDVEYIGEQCGDSGSTRLKNITKMIRVTESCHKHVLGEVRNKTSSPLYGIRFKSNALNEIPRSLRNVSEIYHLDFGQNAIREVTRNDFVEKHSLTYLNLGNNCLQNLTEDVFADLPRLEILKLRNNYLGTLPENLLQGATNLIQFDAGGNDLENVPDDFFQICLILEHVDLSSNKISDLPENLFHKLTKLQKITLSNNRIYNIHLHTFKSNENLRILRLPNNKFTELPTIKLHLEATAMIFLNNNNITTITGAIMKRIPIVSFLFLSENCIKYVPDGDDEIFLPPDRAAKYSGFICNDCCLEKIHPQMLLGFNGHFDFTKNNIAELSESDLKFMSKNHDSTNLSNNKINRVQIPYDYVLIKNRFDTFRTSKINLSGNSLLCDCAFMSFLDYVKYRMYNGKYTPGDVQYSLIFDVKNVSCSGPLNLVNRSILSLGKEEFTAQVLPSGNGNPNCSYIVNCLTNVTYVNCSNLNLIQFPKTYPNETEKLSIDLKNNQIQILPSKNDSIWYRITSLDLKNNQITSLVNLTSTLYLTNINIQGNKLTQFEPELIKFFEVKNINKTIALSQNQWQCNCDLKNKLKVIFNSKNIHVVDRGDLKCLWKGNTYKFMDFDQFCGVNSQNTLLISSLASLTTVVIVFSIVSFIFFKFKIQIKYFLFTRNLCLWWVAEEDIDADKEYDAFISYSSLDTEWVYHILVPGLENEHPRYKVCLHERDWKGGALIADQIVQSVENSRRTILVLTQNFLNSEWSRMEFTVAFQKAIEDKVKRVIVVVPNEVPDLENCDSEFRSFITLTTYIEFNKRYFWRKLRCSMPRRRNLVNVDAAETAM